VEKKVKREIFSIVVGNGLEIRSMNYPKFLIRSSWKRWRFTYRVCKLQYFK